MNNTIENTPSHCHGCNLFADCSQAQNMVANTEPVEGWIYDGEVYCADCTEGVVNDTPYKGESDSPTHCSGCGVPIIHELTAEGVKYVRNNSADGCCRELWPTVWEIKPKIPVDSIVIPGHFIDACKGWEGGMDCMIRAITSTKNLTIGTIRPRGCDTDEKWYLTIWRNLSVDVGSIEKLVWEDKDEFSSWQDISEFEEWINEQIERLEESYGLADWDDWDACDG